MQNVSNEWIELLQGDLLDVEVFTADPYFCQLSLHDFELPRQRRCLSENSAVDVAVCSELCVQCCCAVLQRFVGGSASTRLENGFKFTVCIERGSDHLRHPIPSLLARLWLLVRLEVVLGSWIRNFNYAGL